MKTRTEKAIKKWLALPFGERRGFLSISASSSDRDSIFLYGNLANGEHAPIATFTISSIVAKRYPRRKKVKK